MVSIVMLPMVYSSHNVHTRLHTLSKNALIPNHRILPPTHTQSTPSLLLCVHTHTPVDIGLCTSGIGMFPPLITCTCIFCWPNNHETTHTHSLITPPHLSHDVHDGQCFVHNVYTCACVHVCVLCFTAFHDSLL